VYFHPEQHFGVVCETVEDQPVENHVLIHCSAFFVETRRNM